MDDRKFVVYMHTSPSNKRYIGTTYRKPLYRWHKDGSGYQDNQYFWRAIQKYGWDNFTHEIIAENLHYEDACKLEIKLIKQYDTTNPEFQNLAITYHLEVNFTVLDVSVQMNNVSDIVFQRWVIKILNLVSHLGTKVYLCQKKQNTN